MHDEIASDKRNPTVNANGLIYGATEESTQDLPVLDPVKNTATTIHIPVRDPNTPNSADNQMLRPSPYWGDEKIWDSQASVHNPMFDKEGRVWFTARIRGPDNPAFCKAGSDHPSAKLFPVEKIDAAAGDVRSEDQEVHADRHLLHDAPPAIRLRRRQHAVDQQRRAAEPGRRLARHEDVPGRPATPPKSQGWTAFVLDTNGNGKRDAYVEPNQPVDPGKDKRVVAGFYGISVSPADGSIWGTVARLSRRTSCA